jgi:tRNA-modifying protein YgfZ
MPTTEVTNVQQAHSPAEQRVLRSGCGILDRSERGKLALTGAGAATFLNGQVTNDVERLTTGEGCYAAFLTHKGKMLGDLRILATSSELLLDTERIALQDLFDMIRRFKIGYEVELHKRTLEQALLSLIGPRSREIAATALSAREGGGRLPPNVDPLPPQIEYAHRAAAIAAEPVRLICAASPDGLDVLCNASGRDAVWSALIAAGAAPVGEAAAEALRVEHGIPRYGMDIEPGSVIPQEAGLNERAVSFTKGCYVGQETVARLHYRGKPNRLLRGLRLSQPAAPGEEVHLGDRLVGRLGSTTVSSTLGPIALALLRREAEPRAVVAVGERRVSAEVVELPFT